VVFILFDDWLTSLTDLLFLFLNTQLSEVAIKGLLLGGGGRLETQLEDGKETVTYTCTRGLSQRLPRGIIIAFGFELLVAVTMKCSFLWI
jgi:hypothetical protein